MDKKYIKINFDLSLNKDNIEPLFNLESAPIYDVKKIRKAVNWLNNMLGRTIGKTINITTYNFDKLEDL